MSYIDIEVPTNSKEDNELAQMAINSLCNWCNRRGITMRDPNARKCRCGDQEKFTDYPLCQLWPCSPFNIERI